MLSAETSVQGSAAYVAIEKVSGTLHGRNGTFVLQHCASMNKGTSKLSIFVVPDSGTGELAGLAGTMTIEIAPGALIRLRVRRRLVATRPVVAPSTCAARVLSGEA